MKEKEKRQFFSKREEPHTVRVNGKFGFASLPTHMQDSIKKRLAERDDVMARGLAGEIPGLKIDGKQVTGENIKEFEIPEMNMEVKPKEVVTKKEKTAEKKWSKKELKVMTFGELKDIANRLGETGRSVTGLIKDILKHN